ncbi:MAG: DUF3617 domain-containing protein [Xanthobacteraceae bacterium]
MRLCLSLAAFSLAAISPAAALDLPARKPGLWELRTTHEGRNTPPQTMHQCIDAATDKMMSAMGGAMAASMCQSQNIRQVGGTFVIDATCKIGPMTTISRSVASGDFNSAYSVRVTSKVEGVPAQMQAMVGGNTVIEAKWVSACKQGQKPGDIIMADGKTMNIKNLEKMMSGAGSRQRGKPPQ